MWYNLTEKIARWIVSGGGIAAIIKVLYDYYYRKDARDQKKLKGVTEAQTDLIDDYETAAEYWRERADDLHDEIESIKEQNEILRQQNDLLKKEVDRKKEENDRLLSKIDDLEERNKTLSDEIERTAGYLEQLQTHFDHLRGIVNELTRWLPDDRKKELKSRYGNVLDASNSEPMNFTPEPHRDEDDHESV